MNTFDILTGGTPKGTFYMGNHGRLMNHSEGQNSIPDSPLQEGFDLNKLWEPGVLTLRIATLRCLAQPRLPLCVRSPAFHLINVRDWFVLCECSSLPGTHINGY